ncbi:MAG: DNRLRE domain-containing protein [Epsilonproteobacteria bacterium]|nr:DNRLRE domain-containing protein [Campylobacterota bacterium]
MAIKQIQHFLPPSEMPFTSYAIGTPLALTDCNDVYVMPHADPQDWDQATQDIFTGFIGSGGHVWAACHAVSALENDTDGLGLHLLSDNGLASWNDITNVNTPDYDYDPNSADDPIMQIYEPLSGGGSTALDGGSQEINVLDLGSNWRTETTVAVTDPDNANIVAEGGAYPAPAALVAYGPAYGNGKGYMVYETSHTFQTGTEAQNVSAARIIGNMIIKASLGTAPVFSNKVIPSTIEAGSTVPLSIDVASAPGMDHISSYFTYKWTSNCGGTFSSSAEGNVTGSPATISATFTAPESVGECVVRVIVGDDCGRANFDATSTLIVDPSGLDLLKSVAQTEVYPGNDINYTLTPQYTNTYLLTDLCIRDVIPADTTFVSAIPAYNTGPNCNDADNWYLGSNNAATDGVVLPTYTQQVVNMADIADTGLEEKNPTTNRGTSADLKTKVQAGDTKHSLLNFDVASIDLSTYPTGTLVNSATMSIVVTGAQGGSEAKMYRAITSWTEAGATWDTTDGSTSWAEGSFSSADYDSLELGTLDTTSAGTKTIDVTSLVDGWLNGTFSAEGIALIGTLKNKDVKYGSRENGGNEPFITVTLDVPDSVGSTVSLEAAPQLIVGSGDINVTMNVSLTLLSSDTTVDAPALTVTTSGGAIVTSSVASPTSLALTAPNGSGSFAYVCSATAGANLTEDVVFSATPTVSAGDTSATFVAATSNSVIVSPELKLGVKVDSNIAVPATIDNNATIKDSHLFATTPIYSNTVSTLVIEPGTLTGHLYNDANGNGVQDGTDTSMANVDVLITDSAGVEHNVTTGVDGNYTVYDLAVGLSNVIIDKLDPDFPSNVTQSEGTNPTLVTIVSGANVEENNGFAALPYGCQTSIWGRDLPWTNGDNSGTVTIAPGLDATINISYDANGSTALLSTTFPAIDNTASTDGPYFGGISDLGILQNPDSGAGTSPITITVTFTEPIYNGSFIITDIDPRDTQTTDQVTVTTDIGTPVLTKVNSTNSTIDSIVGTVASSLVGAYDNSNNDDRGSLRIALPDGTTTITIVYEDIAGAADTSLRGIGILGSLLTCKSGEVRGSVKDDTGSALSGVTVDLKNSSGTVIATTTTLADGTYVFLTVPPGEYTVVETDLANYTSISDGDSSADGDTTSNSNTNDNSIPVTITYDKVDADQIILK